jgi:hypothetical protein
VVEAIPPGLTGNTAVSLPKVKFTSCTSFFFGGGMSGDRPISELEQE